eukprot:gnl/MRDRNA2_/MRDRNA2_349642_c0_seq1.p1 gnl/MRDRNA2_/MRDRNA2_349642_c0~~gnl/MRDRNA2_/MRDRNA2_349642_c0_seq1.p1  ORF type:complete len:125 (+),score=21.70 gnl/MRDRNA2_/MRDRNA2_349642_c0_seq1:56-376(+)
MSAPGAHAQKLLVQSNLPQAATQPQGAEFAPISLGLHAIGNRPEVECTSAQVAIDSWHADLQEDFRPRGAVENLMWQTKQPHLDRTPEMVLLERRLATLTAIIGNA